MPQLDVESLIGQLSTLEKIGLLSGIDFWHTRPVPRLDIPSLRFTDGPNGVRGTKFFNGIPAACFPCATALGSTFNLPLLEQAGKLMAEEAKAKGACVILGPTVNIQRGPLGGRGFESFSEDPVLSGQAAAAVINGIQSKGIAATIKHFVCNDQEHERLAVDSIVTQRALREIYLKPFQIAVKLASPAAFMTAYNRVNGTHASENEFLLDAVLRKEWNWQGLVMSDWFGTHSTAGAINAGLDLEMPGPSRWRTDLLVHSLGAKKVLPHTIDERARAVLRLINWTDGSGVPANAPERGRDTPETAQLLRRIAAESIVLLKNDDGILPLKKDKTVAVIGPLAKSAAYCGGGSATIVPYYATTPYEGIASLIGQENVKYSLGAYGHKSLPLLDGRVKTPSGKLGAVMRVYNDPPKVKDREWVDEILISSFNMIFADYDQPKLMSKLWWASFEAEFTPEIDGEYDFGVCVYGAAQLFVDGKLLVDNSENQRPGEAFLGAGTAEEINRIELKAAQTYKILAEFTSAPASTLNRDDGTAPISGGGLRLGMALVVDSAEEIKKAAELAKVVDHVILCVGLNADWESEGFDRPHMDLPEHTDELVSAVISANPNAVVVNQSGTPVTMSWLGRAKAVLQAWYGGNETGGAIADVLFGETNPSGKLSLSFPIRNEDNPAFLNYRSERGRTLYGEDVYVGYRFYEATKRRVAFPFGHGLSYTCFTLSDLKAETDQKEISVDVDVENVGKVAGAEVVQVYISQRAPSLKRPPQELQAFSKVDLEPGQKRRVQIKIDFRYATSFWDEERNSWISEAGLYDVRVGSSSADIAAFSSIEAQRTVFWTGI